MKKGCLIFLGGMAALVLLVMIGSFAVWKNKDVILEKIQEATEQPEHGKETFIQSHFGSMIAAIESAADNSSNFAELKTQLANDSAQLEPVLYVACKFAGSDEIELLKRLDWNGHRTSTSGNYGSGSLKVSGEQIPISIYRRKGAWDYMDTLIVYFRLPEPEAAGVL